MKIDTEEILTDTEKFALYIASQISKIRIRLFCDISFHSLEFRDKETLKRYLDKIPKNDHPLIYILRIHSPKKVKRLIENFERFHAVNKYKTKNKDRVNLSRYNKTSTSTETLYVGSSTTDFKTRIKNHFGTEGTRVYSLHLCKWDSCLEYVLDIVAYEVISENNDTVERFIVEMLEQQFWDKLNPIFGKRSGL